MSDVTIDMRQLKRLDKGLAKQGKDFKKGTKSLLKKIGTVVQGQATRNAPKNKGDLERSITTDIGKDFVSIGVPVNSSAGKYAEKMEFEKGITWHKRGKGTQRKGPQADDKYIERAAKTTDKQINNMIDDVLNGIGM